jgi:S1-C subfamily serine protease
MKVFAACVAVLALSVPALAADWSYLADKLAKSVVYVEMNGGGSCTGFVINADVKGDKDYVLTAAHCDNAKLYADGAEAKVIYKDIKTDLLVLEIDDTGRPALKLAKDNPTQGAEVMSFGFGYGLERPMLRVTHIADDKTYLDVGGPYLVTDATFVPGQSGGPVINQAGEVSMMVQLGTNSVGFGIGAEKMKSKVGRYFEKTP